MKKKNNNPTDVFSFFSIWSLFVGCYREKYIRDHYRKMTSTVLILLCFVWRAHTRTPKSLQQFSCSLLNYWKKLLKYIPAGSQQLCHTVSHKAAWKAAGSWRNLSSPAAGAQHCASLTPASPCADRDPSAIACHVWSVTGATSTW